MTKAEQHTQTMFKRVRGAIIRNGGRLRWIMAKPAMGTRDASYVNMMLRRWIDAGELTLDWDEQGNTLLGLPCN